jgi:hypothetical protein
MIKQYTKRNRWDTIELLKTKMMIKLNKNHPNIHAIFFGEEYHPLLIALAIDDTATKIYNGCLGTAISHDTSAAAYTNRHKLNTYNWVKKSGFHVCNIINYYFSVS